MFAPAPNWGSVFWDLQAKFWEVQETGDGAQLNFKPVQAAGSGVQAKAVRMQATITAVGTYLSHARPIVK
ncbi:endoglucanase [Bacillus sp. OxB-1]|nr:endoglucanase [Bacillus sp. OxB-1]